MTIIDQARATAAQTLIYQATVTRAPTTEPTLNDNLDLVADTDTTVWTGQVGWSPLAARDLALAARTEITATGVLRFPMDATDLQPGDAVTITAATGTRADPQLVDAVFTLGAASTSTILRRFLATRRTTIESAGA